MVNEMKIAKKVTPAEHEARVKANSNMFRAKIAQLKLDQEIDTEVTILYLNGTTQKHSLKESLIKR
jgi:hypothetical protein